MTLLVRTARLTTLDHLPHFEGELTATADDSSHNKSFMSIIEDTLPAFSKEALNVCMLQASLQE